MKIRAAIYATLCAASFITLFTLKIEAWFIFLIMSLFYIHKIFSKKNNEPPISNYPISTEFGTLGRFSTDGNPEDLSYGVYIQLNERPVFIDIREDKLLPQREISARKIIENTSEIDQNLSEFKNANREFEFREVSYLGIHSEDVNQAEVFWHPEGYTKLIIDSAKFIK